MEKKLFTIIELLVVVAIIAILASLLLPSLQKAKEKTKEIKCLSNMKNLFLAESSYIGDNNDYITPIAPGRDTDGNNDYYWTNLLSPYVGFDGETKNKFRDKVVTENSMFFCPMQTPRRSSLNLTNFLNYPNSFVSYGINCFLAGGGVTPGYAAAVSAKLSALKKHSKITLFADTQYRTADPELGFRTLTQAYLTARHSLGFNDLWLDGHASNLKYDWAYVNAYTGEDIFGLLQAGYKYWN